uniref:Essential protein Yae1 N-terminal domain-containing protein n=1 Tax=Anolis carolinensis TaxID=28377 RepID=A0A803SP01_ANOCA
MEGGGHETDIFYAIIMTEVRYYGEGFAEGIHAGIFEGRKYGVQQGANIDGSSRLVHCCMFYLMLNLVL